MVAPTIPLPDTVDFSVQSAPVPGTKRPGQTAHYRNAYFEFVDVNTPGALKTLPEVFDSGYHQGPDAILLGHRPVVSARPLKFGLYEWQTYRRVDVRRRKVGSALHQLFKSGVLKADDMQTVGIWSQNRPEWQIVELALHAYGKVGVSLYDTLGKDSVEYVINHASLPIIFTTSGHIPTLLKMSSKVPCLKMIVSFDNLDTQVRHALVMWGESTGIQVKDLSEIETLGEAHLIDPLPAVVDQVASLCYTSGTTNLPKGVILTHGNLASSVYANLCGLSHPQGVCLMSYLPLAHIYERLIELTIMAIGGCIGYFTGDPLRLLEDAQFLKPHIFPSVPRILNRIYQSAMAAGNAPGIKGALFRMAVQTKLNQLHTTGIKTHPLWDYIVFSKIRAVLGGKIMLISTGSAPISAHVIDFLKIAFYCEVAEGMHFTLCFWTSPNFLFLGYGMTENCGACSHTVRDDPTGSGTIGPPAPVNELKLVDVPAMNYTAEDKPNPRGELCVRGMNCSIGYHKDEKTTQETWKDGWLHTGDVAEVDSQGRFKIIDRVKNIMKLSQGEYVALEKIENLYTACPIVQQIYVHGDGLQSYLIAVVIPDPVVLASLASGIFGKKVAPGDIQVLRETIKDPRVNQEIFRMLNQEAKKNGLAGFEFVKRIHLSMDPFTVEENTLTPTFKLRRRDAYAKYRTELDALYALGEVHGELGKL